MNNNDDVKFWTEPRDGKTSLWVSAGNFKNYNIADIPNEYAVPAVLSAVVGAYNRGVEFASRQSADEAGKVMYRLRTVTLSETPWEVRHG